MSLCNKGVARAKVRASNGKPSVLYNDLLKRLGSRDEALIMYAKVNSEAFGKLTEKLEYLKDVNGEPEINFVLKFLANNRNLTLENVSEIEQTDINNEDSIIRNTIGTVTSDNAEDDMFDAFNAQLDALDTVSMDTTVFVEPAQTTDKNKGGKRKRKPSKPTVDNDLNDLLDEDDDIDNLDQQNRRTRMLIYVQAMQEITNSIAVKHNELASRIRSLKKVDTPEIRTMIVQLNKELTELGITRAFYSKKIAKLDGTITSDELYKDISKQLDYISKELDRSDLTHKMLVKFDKALKVWTNAASVFALEGDNDSVKFNIGQIANKADVINHKFLRVQNKLMTEQTLSLSTNPKFKGTDPLAYNVQSDFENNKDIGVWQAHTMAVNRNPHTALQIIHKIVEKGHMRVVERTTRFDDKIDKLVKNIKNFDDFAEKYADGRHTGMMVHYISPEFREMENKHYEELRREGLDPIKRYRSTLSFIKENRIVLNPALLFRDKLDALDNPAMVTNVNGVDLFTDTYSDQLRDEHIADIVEALGGNSFAKEEFDILKSRLEDRIDAYIINLNAFNEQMPDASNTKAMDKFNKDKLEFILENSPYIATQSIYNDQLFNNTKGDVMMNDNVMNLPSVPRKYELNAIGTANTTVETGNYSKDFAKIMNNPVYKEFYRTYTKRMSELDFMLPQHLKFTELTDNYVAMLDKNFLQLIGTEGISFNDELDKNKLDLYSKGQKSVSSVNKYTGAKEYRLSLESVNARHAEVDNAMKVAMANKVIELKRPITLDEEYDIRRQVMHDINVRKRFDLGDSLKVFNYQVENYMHKVAAEDSVLAVKNILDNAIQTVEGRGGVVSLDANSSFVNLKKQMDYYVEVFYAYDNSNGVSDKKVYTKKDAEKLEEIKQELRKLEEDRMDPNVDLDINEYEARKIILESAENALGQFKSTEQILHSVLKYTQFKAMGFNYGAAITNMIQGYIANTIESKDGRIFTTPQLLKAYAIMGGSVINFYSGSNISSSVANKVRNLAKRYDLIGDTSSELEFNKFNKKGIFSHVYIFQSSTEYLNQGPVIVATMLNIKLNLNTPINGKDTISLWDALDEDGNLRTDLDLVDRYSWEITDVANSGDQFMNSMAKITQSIRAIHGNYSKLSPTLMSSTATLKAMKQFKTWMFESVAQRFEKQRYEEALGMDRKGRYRTGVGVFTWAKPIGYADRDVNAKLICNNTLFVLGQTMKRLMFMKVNAESRFSEVDAANIRKNIAETVITIKLLTLAIVLGGLAKGASDDDDEIAQSVLRYQINVANRLVDDMQMFYNPNSLMNITSNVIPAMSVLIDAQNFIKSIYFMMTGKVTKTGVYAGEAEWYRYLMKSLPFTSKLHSTRAMTNQVMTTVR